MHKGNVVSAQTVQVILYYMAVNNETVTFTETWIKLEIFMLSIILQVQKDKIHIFSSYADNLHTCICILGVWGL